MVFGLVQALRQRCMDVVHVQDRGREQADDADLLDAALTDDKVVPELGGAERHPFKSATPIVPSRTYAGLGQ